MNLMQRKEAARRAAAAAAQGAPEAVGRPPTAVDGAPATAPAAAVPPVESDAALSEIVVNATPAIQTASPAGIVPAAPNGKPQLAATTPPSAHVVRLVPP